MKKKYPGAQERLEQSLPVLGELTTFQKAYPQVVELEAEVIAEPMGFGERETFSYSLRNAPGQYSPCPNPHCSGGGFHVGQFLSSLIHQRQTEGKTTGGCVGREKVGRQFRRCFYHFAATAKLGYAEEKSGDDSEVKG